MLLSRVGCGVSQKCTAKLQRILNFAAKVIYRKGKSEHVTPLLAEFNWLTVKNRVNLETVCFMYRVAHGQVPASICKLFPKVHDKSQRTRQSDDSSTPQTKVQAGKRSLSCRGTALWNSLAPELKQCPNVKSFRRQYQKHLLAQQQQLNDWHWCSTALVWGVMAQWQCAWLTSKRSWVWSKAGLNDAPTLCS